MVILASLAAIELNAFFLKFILWVPPPHSLNFWRVVFWWLLGCAGTRELYYRMQNDSSPVGMMLVLIFVNAALEGIICYKMSTGLFPVPAPSIVKWPWAIVLFGLVFFMLIYFPFVAASPKEITGDAEGAAPQLQSKEKVKSK